MRKIMFLLIALAGASPWAIAQPAPLEPGPKDRCSVCGMFVEKYPNFLAQLALEDGSTAYFDGVKDMMRYHMDPMKFGVMVPGSP